MPRTPRKLACGHTYHITVRCNNRRFNLSRALCRQVLLIVLQKAKEKYPFKLFGLCLMSNHVHYLLEPQQAEDLPKLMHWLNWYSAMCFNRMLKRSGHFWEQRYFSSAFPSLDGRRALNALRYIHANPKAAKMTKGFHYPYSNYGIYAELSDDGLTEWHPAFLELGESLEECAARYRAFCQAYGAVEKQKKPSCSWGSAWLPETEGQKRRTQKQPGQRAFWQTGSRYQVGGNVAWRNCWKPFLAL